MYPLEAPHLMRSEVELAITTGQAVRAVKRSIYFDVYGLHSTKVFFTLAVAPNAQR